MPLSESLAAMVLPPLSGVPRAGTAPPSTRAAAAAGAKPAYEHSIFVPEGLSPGFRRRPASRGCGLSCGLGSRPSSKGARIGRALPKDEDGGSRAARMVQTWWAPVDASMRGRRPPHLEAALRDVHGAQYLRTIHAVRRSASLKASERHALEMEMAARLVSARSLFGKWQSGMQELRAAHKARDMEALSAALERWSFSEDDEEVTRSRLDLRRWRSLAASLPAVLQEALRRRDIAQLREALEELSTSGPASVEGSESARRLLEKYDLQARMLDDAVAAACAQDIQKALECWEFDRDDNHALQAWATLDRREAQKVALRAAVGGLEGPRLREVVEAWDFEPADKDFLDARLSLERYGAARAELERLARPPGDIPGLAAALAAWEFSPSDPALDPARDRVAAYHTAVHAALSAGDGWALQRLWLVGGSGRGLLGAGSLREDAAAALQRYMAATASLRRGLAAAGAGARDAEEALAEQVGQWEFAATDPYLEAAGTFLRLQRAMEAQRVRLLASALSGGSAAPVRGALRRLRAEREECAEVQAAEDVAAMFEAALGAVGSMALDIEHAQLRSAVERSSALEAASQAVRRAVAAVDAQQLMEMKAVVKPLRIVHAVFEVLAHVVGGVSPAIRDPPRDTKWKSCQRMISSAPVFVENLQAVPEWVASGHRAGIMRARELHAAWRRELGAQWTSEGLRGKNRCVAQLFGYLESVFAYADLLSTQGEDSEALEQPRAASADCPPLRSRFITHAQALPPNRPTLCLDVPEDLPGTRWSQPLQVLENTREYLGDSAVIAAAWVVAGRDPAELHRCLERCRQHAVTARAHSAVAEQVLAVLTRPLARAQTSRTWLAESSSEASMGEDGRKVEELGVARGAVLSLVCPSASVLQRLEGALGAVSAWGSEEADAVGLLDKSALEPAGYLLYGPGTEGLAAPSRRASLQQSMLEALQAAIEVVRGDGADGPLPAARRPGKQLLSVRQLDFSLDAVSLTDKFIRTLKVPQVNISVARRSLASREWSPPAVVEFVAAMDAFYTDFAAQRLSAGAAAAAAAEARAALRTAGEVVAFASTLCKMDEPPPCRSAEAVAEVAAAAAEQLALLARRGLALPAVHVEYVRRAIDHAGLSMLSEPPAADSGDRLRWAEAAMAVQLAPLPHFQEALSGAAAALEARALEEAMQPRSAPSMEITRLFAAVFWIVDADCRCDYNWANTRQLISADIDGFIEGLAKWQLLHDGSLARLSRARDLLLEIWDWVALGCGGNHTLCMLFSWASLVVVLLPFVDLWQRLAPLHREVRKGIARVDRATPQQAAVVKAKAWTSALFLLDASGQAWWWLQLIRPAAGQEPPWTDAEDGGVGAASRGESADSRAEEENFPIPFTPGGKSLVVDCADTPDGSVMEDEGEAEHPDVAVEAEHDEQAEVQEDTLQADMEASAALPEAAEEEAEPLEGPAVTSPTPSPAPSWWPDEGGEQLGDQGDDLGAVASTTSEV